MRPDFRDFKGAGLSTLAHSAKGSVWEDHKYIKVIDGKYYYPDSYVGGRHLPRAGSSVGIARNVGKTTASSTIRNTVGNRSAANTAIIRNLLNSKKSATSSSGGTTTTSSRSSSGSSSSSKKNTAKKTIELKDKVYTDSFADEQKRAQAQANKKALYEQRKYDPNAGLDAWEKPLYYIIAQANDKQRKEMMKNFSDKDSFKTNIKSLLNVDTDKMSDDQINEMHKKFTDHYSNSENYKNDHKMTYDNLKNSDAEMKTYNKEKAKEKKAAEAAKTKEAARVKKFEEDLSKKLVADMINQDKYAKKLAEAAKKKTKKGTTKKTTLKDPTKINLAEELAADRIRDPQSLQNMYYRLTGKKVDLVSQKDADRIYKNLEKLTKGSLSSENPISSTTTKKAKSAASTVSTKKMSDTKVSPTVQKKVNNAVEKVATKSVASIIAEAQKKKKK